MVSGMTWMSHLYSRQKVWKKLSSEACQWITPIFWKMDHLFNIDGSIMHMVHFNKGQPGMDFKREIEVSKDLSFWAGPSSLAHSVMEQCGLVIIVLPMTMYPCRWTCSYHLACLESSLVDLTSQVLMEFQTMIFLYSSTSLASSIHSSVLMQVRTTRWGSHGSRVLECKISLRNLSTSDMNKSTTYITCSSSPLPTEHLSFDQCGMNSLKTSTHLT